MRDKQTVNTGAIKLGVNIDHVATLRQARFTTYPDPLQAAFIVEQAGADSITVHLREDRRHIQDHDVESLKQALTIPLNLEMAVTDDMLGIAEKISPDYCCLVPERREELTTEGGLAVVGQEQKISDASERLKQNGIRVSLFIDADPRQIDASVQVDADMIELHTGRYAECDQPDSQLDELNKIRSAVEYARQTHLQINAGHGLHYHNVRPIAALNDIAELNIGHAIIARAIFIGLKEAVSEMKALMEDARRSEPQR